MILRQSGADKTAFVKNTCKQQTVFNVIVFEDGKASVFDGTYSEFEQEKQSSEQTEGAQN